MRTVAKLLEIHRKQAEAWVNAEGDEPKPMGGNRIKFINWKINDSIIQILCSCYTRCKYLRICSVRNHIIPLSCRNMMKSNIMANSSSCWADSIVVGEFKVCFGQIQLQVNDSWILLTVWQIQLSLCGEFNWRFLYSNVSLANSIAGWAHPIAERCRSHWTISFSPSAFVL